MPKLDLNLLVIFDAVMKEQSITAAANRLSMTQPAVSNAVARMRYSWKDPLFIKNGRGLKPTPYAVALWQKTLTPLNEIEEAVSPVKFNPTKAKKNFRVALTDGSASLFWPRIRQIIEKEAPHVNVYAVPFQNNAEQLLVNAEVDIVFDYYQGEHAQLNTKAMYQNKFVCVMNNQHHLSKSALSLDDYLAADHLLVSLSGDVSGVIEALLKPMQRERRIAMTINGFSSAIDLIEQTQLITSLPYALVARAYNMGRVIVKPLPLAVPPVDIQMVWHRRDENSESLQWFKSILERVLADQRHLFETTV